MRKMGDYEPNPHQRSLFKKHIGELKERGKYGPSKGPGYDSVHHLQRGSHPRGTLPNHCVGLGSGVVSRGASIVTRQMANDESW